MARVPSGVAYSGLLHRLAELLGQTAQHANLSPPFSTDWVMQPAANPGCARMGFRIARTPQLFAARKSGRRTRGKR